MALSRRAYNSMSEIFQLCLQRIATKIEVLPWAVFTFFFRRFILVTWVIMILANIHILTASSKLTHVISYCETKSSAIFKTKTIDRPPRQKRQVSAGNREINRNKNLSDLLQGKGLTYCLIINNFFLLNETKRDLNWKHRKLRFSRGNKGCKGH